MNNIKTKLLLIGIFIFIGIIFSWTYMQIHEQVHVSILRSYGISSTTQINWFSASTQPMNQTDYDLKCTEECHQSNNFTDIVGYHTALVIFCITGLFFIKMLWELKQNDEKKF